MKPKVTEMEEVPRTRRNPAIKMKLEISPKRLRMSKKVKLKILKSETSVKVKLMATKREDQEAEAVLAVGDLQAEIKEDMKGRGLEAEAT